MISIEEFIQVIDGVGESAKTRKKFIKEELLRVNSSNKLPPIKWYRKRKNSDIKDALTLEGIKRGYSVRAEKVMGALSEYCDDNDQDTFNRFDLSWEKNENSREFSLAVEIEMEAKTGHIIEDFRKLINNKSSCLKVMVCQAKTKNDIDDIKSAVKAELSKKPQAGSSFLLSIWAWPSSEFVHFQY